MAPIPRRDERTASAFLPPRGETARLLATLWESLLGLDRVGHTDDFFALGGHSLMAAQLISRVREIFGVDVVTPFMSHQSM